VDHDLIQYFVVWKWLGTLRLFCFRGRLSVVDAWARAAMRIADLLVGPAGLRGLRGEH
jgi:hypothetical protein